MQRVVPPHSRLRTQQVAAVVHRNAHAPEWLLGLARDQPRTHGLGEPLGEVHDLDVALVVQVLAGQTLVDRVALAPVSAQVALRFLERRVAAIARGDHAEPGLLDDGEVTRSRRVEGSRIVGFDERAFRTACVARQLVHLSAEIFEHHSRGLLDERETRGDRASPKDRELLVHTVAFHLACVFLPRNENARRNPMGARRAPLLVTFGLARLRASSKSIPRLIADRNTAETQVVGQFRPDPLL